MGNKTSHMHMRILTRLRSTSDVHSQLRSLIILIDILCRSPLALVIEFVIADINKAYVASAIDRALLPRISSSASVAYRRFARVPQLITSLSCPFTRAESEFRAWVRVPKKAAIVCGGSPRLNAFPERRVSSMERRSGRFPKERSCVHTPELQSTAITTVRQGVPCVSRRSSGSSRY